MALGVIIAIFMFYPSIPWVPKIYSIDILTKIFDLSPDLEIGDLSDMSS